MQKKLDAAYDAFDAAMSGYGSFKQANKKVSELLKKWEGSGGGATPAQIASARVLRAQILAHQGHTAAALAEASTLSKATDLKVIQRVLQVYAILGRHDLAADLSDRLFKANTRNEALGRKAFFQHLRAGNHPKQQQVAMRMAKDFQKPEYLFWAVSSYLRQSDVESKPLCAALAGRVLDKALAEGAFTTVEHWHLRRQQLLGGSGSGKGGDGSVGGGGEGDVAAYLALLEDNDGAASKTLPAEYRAVERARALLMLGRWEEARDAFEALLAPAGTDEWSWYQAFVRSSVACGPAAVAHARSSLAGMQERAASGRARGPFLALVLLEHTVVDAAAAARGEVGDGASVEEDFKVAVERLADAAEAFVQRFGHKHNCALDLRRFVGGAAADWCLPPGSAVIAGPPDPPPDVSAAIDDATASSPDNVRALVRYVTRVKLAILCGGEEGLGGTNEAKRADVEPLFDSGRLDSESGACSFVEQAVGVWQATRTVSSQVTRMERGHGDDLALLAAQAVMRGLNMSGIGEGERGEMNSAGEGSTTDRLRLAGAILYEVLRLSPRHSDVLVLLCQVHAAAGASEALIKTLNELKIRNVQNVSLSFLSVPGLLFGGAIDDAANMQAEVVRFVEQHEEDSIAMIRHAHEHSKYSQLLTFPRFLDNLQRSISYCTAKLDLARVALVRDDNVVASGSGGGDDGDAGSEGGHRWAKAADAARQALQLTAPGGGIADVCDYTTMVGWMPDALAAARDGGRAKECFGAIADSFAGELRRSTAATDPWGESSQFLTWPQRVCRTRHYVCRSAAVIALIAAARGALVVDDSDAANDPGKKLTAAGGGSGGGSVGESGPDELAARNATAVVKMFERSVPSDGEISSCGVPPSVLGVMDAAHAALTSMAEAVAAVGGLSSSSSGAESKGGSEDGSPVPRAAMSLAAGHLSACLEHAVSASQATAGGGNEAASGEGQTARGPMSMAERTAAMSVCLYDVIGPLLHVIAFGWISGGGAVGALNLGRAKGGKKANTASLGAALHALFIGVVGCIDDLEASLDVPLPPSSPADAEAAASSSRWASVAAKADLGLSQGWQKAAEAHAASWDAFTTESRLIIERYRDVATATTAAAGGW